MTLEELEKRVQCLEDIEAIKKLRALYAQYCDDNYNSEKLGELFTEDCVFDGGGVVGLYQGKKAIVEFFAKVPEKVSFSVHTVMVPDITIEGNKARAGWYELCMCTLRDGNRAFWVVAFLKEEYKKVDGKWLISYHKNETFFTSPYEEGWGKVMRMKPLG